MILRKRKIENSESFETIKKQKLILFSPENFKSNNKKEINSDKNKSISIIDYSNDSERNPKSENEYTICYLCKKRISNSYIKRHLSIHKRNVECDRCKKKCLESNFKKHKCNTSFYCKECDRYFPSKEKFDNHILSHTRVKVVLPERINCPTCNKNISRKILSRHLKLHQKIPYERKYKCKVCDIICLSKQKFEKHQRMHNNSIRFPCEQCDKKFILPSYLQKHVRIAHDHEQKSCPVCNKKVIFLESHLKIHDDRTQQCEICGIILKNKVTYIAHKNNHARLPVKKSITRNIISHQCKVCNKRIYGKERFLIHSLGHNLEDLLFPCPFCDEVSCKSMPDLFSHVSRIHRNIQEPFTQCLLCDKIVINIEEHFDNHNLNQFECEFCEDNVFNDQLSLENHLKKKHLQKKKKKLNKSALQRRHIQRNLRKTACLICRKKIYICKMRDHWKTHQTYKCQICTKTCISLESYWDHKTTHGKKCIFCLVCSKRFNTDIRLFAHMTMCHDMSLNSCSCSTCNLNKSIP